METTDYILAGTPEGEASVARFAASQLELKKAKISHIVLSMKDFINGTDLIQQAKAIEYLATILEKLDRSFLSWQDVSLLVTYLSARIETAHVAGVKETAIGLRALAAMSHFDVNDTPKICRKIFLTGESFNAYPASTRLEVYRLVDFLMREHRDQLKTLEGEFISGILSLAELEKDPRCLMLYFATMLVVIAEWNTEEHVNDLWEAVTKYFPITFRAKPDDPTGITRDDLKLRLRMCVAGSSEFAPLAFPYLIEKLDYGVTANVKRDVIQTLTACINSYSPQEITKWNPKVWNALKYEILNASEDELADEALIALKSIASRLSSGIITLQTLESTALHDYIGLITEECVKQLREPQHRYAKQCGQIIGKIATGSPFAFHLLVRIILPEITTVLQDTAAISKKTALLEVLNRILDARLQLVEDEESSEFPTLGILDAVSESSPKGNVAQGGFTLFCDWLFETFDLSLTNSPSQETSIRITALKGLLKLVKIPRFLASMEVGMIIQHVDELILDKNERGESLREEAITALRGIAELYPQQITEITFPAFLGNLPDTLTDDKDSKDCLSLLEALARIASDQNLFPVFVRRLLNKLDDVVRKGVSQTYAHMILAGLLYAVRQRENGLNNFKKSLNVQKNIPSGRDLEQDRAIVRHLYRHVTILSPCTQDSFQGQKFVGLRLMQTAGGLVYPDGTFVELVGKIAMTIIRSMSLDDQDWASKQVFAQFAVTSADVTEPEVKRTQMDLIRTGKYDPRTLALSMYMLAGIHKEAILDFHPDELCDALLRTFSIPKESAMETQESALCFMALLINKWNATTAISRDFAALKRPQDTLLSILADLDSLKGDQALRALQMGVIFTMAANLKGDRATKDLLNMMLNHLSNRKYGAKLAKDFKYLLAPSKILCRENSAIMRGLYKQRPFAVCVPRILELFKTCDDGSIKSNYLVALSGILRYTPTEIVLPEVERLMPVLLQSLEAPAASVKSASIQVLQTAITESPKSVEGHLLSIINRLSGRILNTAEHPSDAPSAIRVMALKCLALIPGKLDDTSTLRHKTEVLRQLDYALNDTKRNVREEAVRCRLAWFNLAETAEESE